MASAERAQPEAEAPRSLDFLLADLPLLAWSSGADPRHRQFLARWDFLPALRGEDWLGQIVRAQRIDVETRLRQAAAERRNFSMQYEFVSDERAQRVLDRGFATPEGYQGVWIDLENPALSRSELFERLHELSQPLTVALHWLQGSRRRVERGHPADADDVALALERALDELQRAVGMLGAWRRGR